MAVRTFNLDPFFSSRILCVTSLAIVGLALASCTTEKVQQRTDERNQAFYRRGMNADIRQDARDKRYEAAWNWIMD